MAKRPKKPKKRASEMTSDEAMNHVFGKGAAKRLREVVADMDATKGKKTKRKTDVH
jgi:hypothetical protein